MARIKTKLETICGDTDFFFSEVDPIKSGISELTKDELIELVQFMNRSMIASTENWDGG